MPFEEKKWPDTSDFLGGIEVKPSNEIQIQKLGNYLNFIYNQSKIAAPSYVSQKNISFITNVLTLQENICLSVQPIYMW